eukprot:TRINITY_DN18431_c0_g1_i1.p1 TRINITY_DN18431_c0_g1~~TRINITY_DN18431_c0_g1_i1.p1  ORF type:complete len:443 (+),score=65.51 TRINITY_DN18431_c0_g1_i1:58-1386(+)
MFEDKDFPVAGLPSNIEWTRVSKMGTVHSGIAYCDGDASQGFGFRDCWLIGALATIGYTTEDGGTKLLKKDPVEEGKYTLDLVKVGKPVQIHIDDRLPTVNGKPIFASSTTSWWIPLAEKAFAKAHGGYQNIMGGLETYAFMDLTGWASNILPTNLDLHTADFIASKLEKKTLLGLSFLDQKQPHSEYKIRAKVTIGDRDLQLVFTVDDDPSAVAEQFCAQNDIAPCKKAAVASFISQHQNEKKAADREHRAEEIIVPPEDAKKPEKTKSVIPSHSYSILKADTESNTVMVHNPWGTGVVEGGIVKQNDPPGAFWIPVPLMCQMFNAIHIAVPSSLHQVYQYSTAVGPDSNGMSIVVPEHPSPMTILLLSPEPRWDGSPKENNVEFPLISFMLKGCDGRKRVSPIAALRQVSIENVPSGEYQLVVDNGSVDFTYSVMVFSEH